MLKKSIAAASIAALASLGLMTPAHAAPSRADIALRWAPIHYQDVDATGSHALGGKSDYLSRYDYDGDLIGRNNWDNAATSGQAAVYYDVVETGTHWFITYFFYHARDWVDHPFFEGEHENDGEGLTEMIEKDGSEYGVLRAMVTVAHTDFFSYTPAGSTWTNGGETIDGTVQMQSSPHDAFQHPVTAQEVQGHGLKAWPQYTINGDGIIYYPSTTGETPGSGNDRDVRYQLVDIFNGGGMWANRATSSLFVNLGTFAGDDSGDCGVGTWDCTTDSANAPWGWDDGNDVPARGEIATDPAKLSAAYFTVPGSLSRTYTYNPYAGASAALKEAARTAPKVID